MTGKRHVLWIKMSLAISRHTQINIMIVPSYGNSKKLIYTLARGQHSDWCQYSCNQGELTLTRHKHKQVNKLHAKTNPQMSFRSVARSHSLLKDQHVVHDLKWKRSVHWRLKQESTGNEDKKTNGIRFRDLGRCESSYSSKLKSRVANILIHHHLNNPEYKPSIKHKPLRMSLKNWCCKNQQV